MKSTIQWLDAAKQMHSLSDYALAPKLGISRSQMSKYRGGADFLSDDAAIKMAELLGLDDAGQIIASAHAERAKSEQSREFWAQLADRLQGVAVSVLLAAGLAGAGAFSPDAAAASRSQNQSNSTDAIYTSYKSGRRKKTANWTDILGFRRRLTV